MTDNPRNLNETDLDRLLSAASEDHRQTQAPGGFSASVMNNISREDALLANSPLTNSTEAKTAASRTWIGVGAAAAFVLLAFAAGWYAGSDLNNSNNVANRGEQNSNVNDPARKGSFNDNNPDDNNPDDSNSGSVTVEDLKNDMGAEAGPQVKKPERGPGAVDNDLARPGSGAPSTLAGRFPRSADRRVYCVINILTSDVTFAPYAFSMPSGKAAESFPRLDNHIANVARVAPLEAETILKALDLKYNSSMRPLLAAYSGTLIPVTGVVTPPRIEDDTNTASRANAAAGDDLVELVIYTKIK